MNELEPFYTIDMPTQDEIPKVIVILTNKLTNLQAQEKYIIGQINLMRSICKHPTTQPVSHTGRSYTRCLICKKEW
jgi:hypothetical protein